MNLSNARFNEIIISYCVIVCINI